jgi:hypothetical protein
MGTRLFLWMQMGARSYLGVSRFGVAGATFRPYLLEFPEKSQV